MTYDKPGLLVLAACLATACSESEAPPAEDHTPTSYGILIDDATVTEPYLLTAGQTVRVRLKFFNKDQEDLDEVEGSHYGGLTIDQTSIASVRRVPDHNYQFDVTAINEGTGTLQVSFGHDPDADEHPFPAAAVTVNPDEGPVLSQ